MPYSQSGVSAEGFVIMKIKLTNCEEYFQIDDEDYEKIKQWKWRKHHDGYAIRTLNFKIKDGTYKQKTVQLHMQLMGRIKGFVMDHINRDKLDNRKSNLRFATHSQNRVNFVGKKTSKSGYRGVSKENKAGTFRACICVNYTRIEVNGFKTAEEAAEGYNELARKYHGEFAILNEV